MPGLETLAIGTAGGVAGNIGAGIIKGQAEQEAIHFLRAIATQLTAQSHYAAIERQRTIYPINLNPGRIHYIDGKERMYGWLISGAPGDELALVMGSAQLFQVVNPTGAPILLPLPLLLTAGADLSVTNVSDPSDVTFRSSLWCYRDVSGETEGMKG